MGKEHHDRHSEQAELDQHDDGEQAYAYHAGACFRTVRTLCSRTGTLNGLAMWSVAPSSSAVRMSRSPVREVSMTTLLERVTSPALSRRRTSRPLSAGRSTSSRMTAAWTS